MRTDVLHGVLVVDKPAGATSAAIVAKVKRALSARRVGHTGTLDPMATGVLPIVIGEGTKLATFLLCDDKEYEGELELGVTTDTIDAEGRVLKRTDASHVAEAALLASMAALVGELDQIPPMHSALHVNGQRLYELARAGVTVERQPRRVRVDRFELLSYVPPRARFVVACGKGTYVRSLVRDVGDTLGVGATLTQLRRTRAGRFALANAISLDDLPVRAATALVSTLDALDHLPLLPVDHATLLAVRHGRPVPIPVQAMPGSTGRGTTYRVVTPTGDLVAVVLADAGHLKVLRGFH